jgi:hypothetical protein
MIIQENEGDTVMTATATARKFAVARMSKGKVKVISGQLESIEAAGDVLLRKGDDAFVIEMTAANPRKKNGKGPLTYMPNSTAFRYVTSEFV